MISVVILTKNSAQEIERALRSVSSFPEVLIVDGGSTDSTLSKASFYPNTRLVSLPFDDNFSKIRNQGASLATFDWILQLDSDEEVTEELAQELLKGELDSDWIYQIRRRNFFGIEEPRIWQGDRVCRCYDRRKYAFSGQAVHEKILGPIKACSFPLIHRPKVEISSYIQKMDLYSSLFATQSSTSKRCSFAKVLLHTYWSFFKSYFLSLGFLDGATGFYLAKYTSDTVFYKYMKVREKNQNLEQTP